MPSPSLSVTIITLNEEKNLERALKSVSWADDVVVVDCGSKDRTPEIAVKYGARLVHNPWLGYGQQKNFAQNLARQDWVLNLDADEEVSPELREEILSRLQAVADGKDRSLGFRVPRKTFYLGRWILHGGWYPNYLLRLANKRHARWTEPEVHEELIVEGQVQDLANPLLHYSFASIQDQVRTNLRYSWQGFKALGKEGQLPSLKLLILKPIGKFVETYVLKRGFLDGLPGLIISINAAHSIFLKYAYLFEAAIAERLNADPDHRQ